MRLNNFFIVFLIFLSVEVYSQNPKYPKEDFYNRNIDLPIDYGNPDEGTFTLYYQLSSNFDFNRPTIFFFQDSQQNFGKPGKVDDLAKDYQFDESFNLVRFQHRGRKYSYIEVENEDGTINWEKVYRVLTSKQVVEDIERVRQDLFSKDPDTKIYLYGRSGGGYLIQEYLAKYAKFVEKAFIRCAPNPLIMEKLGYLESKHLFNSINAVDPTLHKKLKTVLEKDVVPQLQLLWLFMRLGYQNQKPGPIQAKIINELYENTKDTYNSYMVTRGFDYEKIKANPVFINEMGLGWYLRPIECDGIYLLGPPPEYIDPIYYCFRDFSSQIIRLIEEKIVPPPTFPPLSNYKEIKTEVFYLAGKNDHMSPYQIGMELGNYFQNYELLILDDNHSFIKHKECLPSLRNAFFKYGIGSEQLQEVRKSLQCEEWKPE